MKPGTPEEDLAVDIADAIGASESFSTQILTLYIPDRDRIGVRVEGQRDWVRRAAELLAKIGGGVTIMPPVEGGWYDEERDHIVWEHPIMVYTYVKPHCFVGLLPELRAFLHQLGAEANQGEIAVEFDGEFFRITDFDHPRVREG